MFEFTFIFVVCATVWFSWTEYTYSQGMARVHFEWLELAKEAERIASELEEASPTLNNKSGLLHFDANLALITSYRYDAARYRFYAERLSKHARKVQKIKDLAPKWTIL